ncbi:hypothetical protein, partial [Corynebacterium belfantii]|uniref:hypothetical protein n=1 Tax=Corynebacterium belfantii TaxID=2014537 RepID=UPI001A7E4DAA
NTKQSWNQPHPLRPKNQKENCQPNPQQTQLLFANCSGINAAGSTESSKGQAQKLRYTIFGFLNLCTYIFITAIRSIVESQSYPTNALSWE